MQLTPTRSQALRRAAQHRTAALWIWLACLATPAVALAQSGVDLTGTAFYESGGPLHMLVLNPAVNARADLGERASVRAGWEADVVTGASVAVVDAPSGGGAVDAITSATTVKDFRQVVKGGASLRGDDARLDVGYGYGFEHDYRSHALTATASTDLAGRNTHLAIRYGRGWDEVCDLAQPEAQQPVQRQRMPTSEGCFEKSQGRTTHDLSLHSLEGVWTQAWTPIFNTQLTLSSQVLHGFQSNPYRAIWLGRAAVQEHHPRDRARYAVGLASRVWLRPLAAALQLEARLYRDTWDVSAVSAELGLERAFGERLRVRARGRYYTQSRAAFFSDDYALAPRGQYFSGDRELSQMQSWLVGLQATFIVARAENARLLGLFDVVRLLFKADYIQFIFSDFQYGAVAIPNRRAGFATLGLDATF
jgi:Protein of unknown function (DUF3570)